MRARSFYEKIILRDDFMRYEITSLPIILSDNSVPRLAKGFSLSDQLRTEPEHKANRKHLVESIDAQTECVKRVAMNEIQIMTA